MPELISTWEKMLWTKKKKIPLSIFFPNKRKILCYSIRDISVSDKEVMTGIEPISHEHKTSALSSIRWRVSCQKLICGIPRWCPIHSKSPVTMSIV